MESYSASPDQWLCCMTHPWNCIQSCRKYIVCAHCMWRLKWCLEGSCSNEESEAGRLCFHLTNALHFLDAKMNIWFTGVNWTGSDRYQEGGLESYSASPIHWLCCMAHPWNCICIQSPGWIRCCSCKNIRFSLCHPNEMPFLINVSMWNWLGQRTSWRSFESLGSIGGKSCVTSEIQIFSCVIMQIPEQDCQRNLERSS